MSTKTVGSGQYSRRTYNKAVRLGAAVLTARGTAGQARRHHRDNLLKWVNARAVNEERKTITDPRKLVPYRGASYRSGVQALMSYLPSEVRDLTARCSQEFESVKEWGFPMATAPMKWNYDIDGVIATNWIWGTNLFNRAKKYGCKGRYEAFVVNMRVLQRVTGYNAYGIPLRDCKYAIDSKWGERGGKQEIMFRLVVGRGEPIKVRKNSVEEYFE